MWTYSDENWKFALRGVIDMADKQPAIRPHIWLIALGVVIAFALLYFFI